MFTYKQKKKAINLYYKYNKHLAKVVNKLGYPSVNALRLWIREYEKTGKISSKYRKKARFTKQEIDDAINYYYDHGENMKETVKALGYPCRYTLQKWLMSYSKKYKPRTKKPSNNSYTSQDKLNAVIKLCSSSESAETIANEYNITRVGLNQWKDKYIGKGKQHSMTKKKIKDFNNEIEKYSKQELLDEISQLKVEAIELKRNIEELQMKKDILEKAAELIKKDEGINIDDLSNKEKVIVIDALRKTYKLNKLLKALELSKSSYFYTRASLSKEDKYKELRSTIKEIFIENKSVYGYRRINIELKNKSIILSEKVIRRIMKEDGLVVYRPKMKKYSSYEGEISPEVDNLLKRNFHSDGPFEKLLTDLTEFSIPSGKVYLSPMIDCFDGLPIAWTIGTSPNAQLTNSMLDEVIKLTPAGKNPIVHSDRGCHYRWPSWIDRMNKANFVRSMSKKGCSPDNSACEGFFGRLKNEFFYPRKWQNVTIDEFIKQLNDYLEWYANKRIKVSLGGLSPIDYRKSLGLI